MASEAQPQSLAQPLDGVSVECSVTAAKQRHLMLIHGAQRQRQYGRPGYGPRPG